MPWVMAPPDQLAACLDPPGGIALVVGAGISLPAPSRLPTAGDWKAHLLAVLAHRADLGFESDPTLRAYLHDLSRLGSTTDLKLEAVLQTIDDKAPGLARALVRAAIDGATPNPLHDFVVERLRSGAARCVVTPNFDELIETAAGGALSSWTTGEAPTRAQVLHPHGRVGSPSSLRHTLNRFDARLPLPEHELVAEALAGEVVALGWSATDPDLLAALNEGTGSVHVLIQGSVPTPETHATLEKLAELRPVVLHPGGFAQLVPNLIFDTGRQLDIGPAGRTKTETCLRRLPAPDARSAVAHLSFRSPRPNPRHELVLNAWSARAGPASERVLLRLAEAEEAQAGNRPGRAVLYNLRVWASTKDPAYLSASADALERVGRGLNPLKRVLALPVHAAAVWLQSRRSAHVDPWVRARLARSISGVGLHRAAGRQIDKALEDAYAADSSLWVRGHLHRLRALESAHVGKPWGRDIDHALEVFRFDNRTIEMGSVHRARAACIVITGQPGWRAEALRSLERCEELYRQGPDASALPLLRAQRSITRLPLPLARLLLHFA